MKQKEDFKYGQNTAEVDYWVQNRSKLSDLYKSERHFFDKVILKVDSVLDIGCAAGGSALFCRELGTASKYLGIDVSSSLVEVAKKRFSEMSNTNFIIYDGTTVPLADNSV